MLLDGGGAFDDIRVLRHQEGVLGPVASALTAWRTFKVAGPSQLKKIAATRARTRKHVWASVPGGVPESATAGRGLGATVVLDVDATIVVAHSEKEKAAATFKRTFGHHPIGCGVTTHQSSCRRPCGLGTRGRTPLPITSTCSRRRWPRSPPPTAASC